MITFNGEKCELKEKISVYDFIISKGYRKELIAVEIDGEIIPKADYNNRFLVDGSSIEVVSFVGGG